MDVRHGSFVDLLPIRLLCRYATGVVLNAAGHWPCIEDLVADFVYLHLHGTGSEDAGAYKRPNAAVRNHTA
ncbi:hypothetical protein [Burkholderia sp. b13]|uniref:hypothetical protein n=1 Tax=Burkholderiaceae TaxID=119060 RepID=UPI00336C03EC